MSLQDTCGIIAMPCHVYISKIIAGQLYMKTDCPQEPQCLGLEALYNVGMPADLPVLTGPPVKVRHTLDKNFRLASFMGVNKNFRLIRSEHPSQSQCSTACSVLLSKKEGRFLGLHQSLQAGAERAGVCSLGFYVVCPAMLLQEPSLQHCCSPGHSSWFVWQR